MSLLVGLGALPLAARQATPVDLTGNWIGSLTPTDGENKSGAYFSFKQKGADLAGTAGPDANRQAPIANGKVATVKGVTSVTFDSTQPNGLVMKFDLKLVEGRLKGSVVGELQGEKRTATIDVGRSK
jgi:hypothetical protein